MKNFPKHSLTYWFDSLAFGESQREKKNSVLKSKKGESSSSFFILLYQNIKEFVLIILVKICPHCWEREEGGGKREGGEVGRGGRRRKEKKNNEGRKKRKKGGREEARRRKEGANSRVQTDKACFSGVPWAKESLLDVSSQSARLDGGVQTVHCVRQ